MKVTPREDPKSPAPGDNAIKPGGPHAAPFDPGMTELDRDAVPIMDEDEDLPPYDGEPLKDTKD